MARWRKGETFTSDHVVRNHAWWTRIVGGVIGHGIWNLQVIGADKVPASGPVIVASNHVGVADGPLIHIALPRKPHIMTKLSMFNSKLAGVLRASGQFPVDRSNGRAALSIAKDLLEEGRVVALFPEGTRGTGGGAGIKAGVAWLALHAGAPVVPAACLGTRPTGASVGHIPRFRARMYVVFGDPIVLPADLPRNRDGVARAIDIISAGLSDHIAQAIAITGVDLPGDAGARGTTDGAFG